MSSSFLAYIRSWASLHLSGPTASMIDLHFFISIRLSASMSTGCFGQLSRLILGGRGAHGCLFIIVKIENRESSWRRQGRWSQEYESVALFFDSQAPALINAGCLARSCLVLPCKEVAYVSPGAVYSKGVTTPLNSLKAIAFRLGRSFTSHPGRMIAREVATSLGNIGGHCLSRLGRFQVSSVLSFSESLSR